MKTTLNAHIVPAAGGANQSTVDLYIDNLPGAKPVSVAAVAAADAAVAAGAAPTKAEFDKVVALANETKKQLNALLAALK